MSIHKCIEKNEYLRYFVVFVILTYHCRTMLIICKNKASVYT